MQTRNVEVSGFASLRVLQVAVNEGQKLLQDSLLRKGVGYAELSIVLHCRIGVEQRR